MEIEKIKLRKKLREEYSDVFLKEVILILKLGNDFKFTEKTKVIINDEQKNRLKQCCEKNKEQRIAANKLYGPSKSWNIKWAYDVLLNYFNLEL